METSKGKKYRKVGDPLEVMVFPSNSYDELLTKCVEALDNQIDEDDKKGHFKLMKAGGSRISAHSILVDGATLPWTIGAYLQATGKKPSQVNFGIAASTEV